MASELPNYIAAAKPVPQESRSAWFTNTAPAYAGIFLWFVFWQDTPVGRSLSVKLAQYSAFAGGSLAQGLLVAFAGLFIGALLCHFLFYLAPGLLGVKTGLPLYIVGTSTYGARGGLLMPGFLMGVLQFGWIGVNAFFSSDLLCKPFGYGFPSVPHAIVVVLFVTAAIFMGLKGIKYVGKVATFLPIIPLVILIILLCSTAGGLGGFCQETLAEKGQQITQDSGEVVSAGSALSALGIILLMAAYTVGFFATAGAAGTDMGMNNRSPRDVHLAGLTGIVLAMVVTGGLAMLIVAGAHGGGKATDPGVLRASFLMEDIMGKGTASVFWWLLAIAAFPPACFSAFIASNSFKTTLPKVNPFISVGIGTLLSIILAITGLANKASAVFVIIGASFGPVCGAMAADYLLAGRKWAGPRAGFNPAGWISWIIGLAVGAVDFIAQIPGLGGLQGTIPAPPVAAFVVGFVLYVILAKMGLTSKTLEMPQTQAEPAAEAEPEPEPEN